MAQGVIEKVRTVTDKPIKYVGLSHYHAVRVLGASAYGATDIIASEKTRAMIHERGMEDWGSEFARMPRLFQSAEGIPGLTWPTVTFNGKMTIYLGRRRVDFLQLGRAHTAGDIVTWVPDARVMLTGDIVEYHSACYCGDAHFSDWPGTLDAIASHDPVALSPGRGDALVGRDKVTEAIALTRDFVTTTYRSVAQVASRGGSLKDAVAACRAECDPKFYSYAIYEHCLPFNVGRAYDEALGIDTPRIWTAERDQEVWALARK
jgi:glyoxylase-like metal-dependent hydrolase (beta-lactamase superfamily II)